MNGLESGHIFTDTDRLEARQVYLWKRYIREDVKSTYSLKGRSPCHDELVSNYIPKFVKMFCLQIKTYSVGPASQLVVLVFLSTLRLALVFNRIQDGAAM